jgi:hypothetical protein
MKFIIHHCADVTCSSIRAVKIKTIPDNFPHVIIDFFVEKLAHVAFQVNMRLLLALQVDAYFANNNIAQRGGSVVKRGHGGVKLNERFVHLATIVHVSRGECNKYGAKPSEAFNVTVTIFLTQVDCLCLVDEASDDKKS